MVCPMAGDSLDSTIEAMRNVLLFIKDVLKKKVLIFHKSSDPVLTDWSLTEIQSYDVVGLF